MSAQENTTNTDGKRHPEAPRTLGELRGLLTVALAIVEGKGPIRRLARRDLRALLRAALRYRRRVGE